MIPSVVLISGGQLSPLGRVLRPALALMSMGELYEGAAVVLPAADPAATRVSLGAFTRRRLAASSFSRLIGTNGRNS